MTTPTRPLLLQLAVALSGKVAKAVHAFEQHKQAKAEEEGLSSAALFLQLGATSQAKEQLDQAMLDLVVENRVFEKVLSADTSPTSFSKAVPSAAGWYWHWSGEQGQAPVVRQVRLSGVSARAYATEGPGAAFYRYCDELGGLWQALPVPATS